LLPLWVLARHWAEVALFRRNVHEAWRWTVDDVKWLLLMGPATLSPRVRLPEQGKFNAAEKINFMLLTATWPLYLGSGLLIWSHQFAFPAWILHLSLAAVATPLVFGHIFMATVNPDTRVGLKGMISGWVSREWARHHYRHWYDEHFGHLEHAEPATVSAEPAPTALPAGVALPASSALPVLASQPAAALQAASRPPAATVPVAVRPRVSPVPVAARPLVPALSVGSRPPAHARPVTEHPVLPAAIATDRSQAARPAKILWPPDAHAADPSFAS
jgi:cytochrome b subunit of formate dehydrogenase